MPTFDTPQPITVTVEIGVGDVRIVAGDRTDTVVVVRPTNPDKTSDVTAAEQTRVEYDNGALLVRSSRGWRRHTVRGEHESIDVQIELPSGSQLRGSAGIADFHCSGRLGDCRLRTGIGQIHVEETGAVAIRSGMGDVAVDRVVGDVHLTIGSGVVRIGSIAGTAVVKHSNGDTWIGKVSGHLRVNAANGKIVVDHAGATVAAKTARGDIRLGEVANGAIVAQTAIGTVDIGILDGVAAWLDLRASVGNVTNDLDDAPQPAPGEGSVEVHGTTSVGDITIRRAFADAVGAAS